MNVVKHAKASEVVIGVHRVDGSLRIQVNDDGVGLEPGKVGRSPSDSGGFGLFSLRERIGLLGGSVAFESDGGTRVTVLVPLHTEAIPPA